MQHLVAKRILGGIAWACALPIVMLMTSFASSQDAMIDPSHSAPSPSPPTTQDVSSLPQQPSRQPHPFQPGLRFQPGLSSKEYLRLMAEANELGLKTTPAALPQGIASFDPKVRLATAGSGDPAPAGVISGTSAPTLSLPERSVATPPTPSTSAQPVVQSDLGASIAGSQIPNPRFSLSYENVWLRRSGDEGTSWSSGGALGTIGEDRATAIRMGWYSNPMERYEFAFLGSLVWHRSAVHSQPANSLLNPSNSEPDWSANFQNSFQHDQFHTARLRSYEFNKRWITDDLGNYFLGLNIIDYDERYGLRSLDSDGSGLLGYSTNNLLAGMQGGLELWHPLSQRFAVGGQGVVGLYGNFADGDWHLEVEDEALLRREDRRFQTAAGFGLNGKGRYQFTSRLSAFGSYRWWYLAGIATVDDQTMGLLAPDTPFALSTDAGFLIHGATCGLEFVF
jgi:hypothetical protein